MIASHRKDVRMWRERHSAVVSLAIAGAAALALNSHAGATVSTTLPAPTAPSAIPAGTTYNPTQTQIGLPQLLAANSGLTGAGVTVAQVEAPLSGGDYFEPTISQTGVSPLIFTFVNGSGTVSTAQNTSEESGHATYVGQLFYGTSGGISPGISQIYVFDANDAYLAMANGNTLIPTGDTIAPAVVNQSFVFPGENAYGIQYLDSLYDNYAAAHNTLFVSAIGDGGSSYATGTSPVSYVNPPADAYNGIGVAALNGGSGVGPTYDGRSKPDITAPGSYTSYTTPIVSGAATLLIQAGDNGIGGAGTQSAATDIRTVKALLLNGAVKPTGWTNSYTVNSGVITYNAPTAFSRTPLDPRYGAGVVNVYNSYEQLAAGEHTYSTTATQAVDAAPVYATTAGPVETSLTGWNLATITSGTSFDAAQHYLFNLPGTGGNSYDLTATLTWNRQVNQTAINNLSLYLMSAGGSELAGSFSTIDNVQQLTVSNMAPGSYDLQVIKLGGTSIVSASETYALAFNFVDPAGPVSNGGGTIPEPATWLLMMTGAASISLLPRRAFSRARA